LPYLRTAFKRIHTAAYNDTRRRRGRKIIPFPCHQKVSFDVEMLAELLSSFDRDAEVLDCGLFPSGLEDMVVHRQGKEGVGAWLVKNFLICLV